MPEAPILRVESLRCVWGERTILEDVSFDVARGEVVVILGGSGSGKSTLLKNVIGLVRPAGGRVLIQGEDFTAAEGDARRRMLRRFGVTYQQNALFGSMTLLENVLLPLEEFTDLPAEARELVARLKLRLVGLEGFEGYLPAAISGGMRKRAAIARALAVDPELILYDEPTADLDPILTQQIGRLIARIRDVRGSTQLFVTHNLPLAQAIADRIAVLAEGRIAEYVSAGELGASRHPLVREFLRATAWSPDREV